MSYTSGQFMINAKPGIPQVMFISTYLVINHYSEIDLLNYIFPKQKAPLFLGALFVNQKLKLSH
jgi:hypothetical protein